MDTKAQIIPVRPTVFVGLGGTGKEILLRLRTKFHERYSRFGYPCMAYLWLDTDLQNLNVDRKEMDAVLQRALFKPNEIVDIQVGDPSDFLNNPNKFPWIKNWIPQAVWQSGLRIQDGAGQVRAKGRFGFYWNFPRVQASFMDAITAVRGPQARVDTDAFNQQHGLNLLLDEDWGTKVNFFIVGSLAGGTGSGTFLDAPFLVRYIAASLGFKPDITGLLFLSSLFTNSPQDRRFANTYAALKELEYYNYTPEAGARDIESDKDAQIYALRKFEEKWSATEPGRPLNGPPFNTCYLIDGVTFSGTPITPAHKYEVFDMASEYLFWEFYQGEFASQKRTLRPNNRQYLDRNHPEPHGPENTPFHMQRFSTGYSSFGFSWIRVPVGSRISACGYRLGQEVLELWERGGVMERSAAQEALRRRNLVEEVRRSLREDPLNLDGQLLTEYVATTKDGRKFSDLIKEGIKAFHDLPEDDQDPETFAETFEKSYLSRRTGAVIHEYLEPAKNRALGEYKDRVLKWVVSGLATEGFIPLLGFLYDNPDGSQGKVNGYLDILADVVLPEIKEELERIKADFESQKEDADERKGVFFRNFSDLADHFVLFRNLSRKTLINKCLEAEQDFSLNLVGEWISDVALQVVDDLREYIRDTRIKLKRFYDAILSPTITEFAGLRKRHELEDQRTLSINLYRPLDQYYRLDGNSVDVRAEKEQLFGLSFPDLWKVTSEFTADQFRKPVEEYCLRKFQLDFQRRLGGKHSTDPLANAVQLFNESYPPSEPTQRRNQISIFLEGGKPYVQPRLTLGPRAPQPHEDLVIGMAGLTPEAPPGINFFKELTTQNKLARAQGIETEPEAVLYYHELTGLPLFYLSTLEQYRRAYDFFQGRVGDLPVHIHRRVDVFPEIFLYTPEEARGMFDAWEMLIIGTVLRVLQVERVNDDLRYFYYSGYGADTKVIGDERGSVRTFFTDPAKYAWCSSEIEKRKKEILGDPDRVKLYYGILQLLAREVFKEESVYLADGKNVTLASFQASVIQRSISETEQKSNGTLPRRNPGDQLSPEWDKLMEDARQGSESVQSAKDDLRYFLKQIAPFAEGQQPS